MTQSDTAPVREPGGWRWLVLSAGAALVVVAGLLVLTDRVPGFADCIVEVGDHRVDLDTGQAQRAASTVAGVLRRTRAPGRSVARATQALQADGEWGQAEARALARSLTGRERASFTCEHAGETAAERDRLNARGLTPRADRVRRDLTEAFGPQQYGGFAPGGISSGHREGSTHYAGRALDVFFRPVTRRNRVSGWAMAHYLVAHAERLDISTVIFDGRIWTARRGAEGWRDYRPDTTGRNRSVARVLEHRDHVHVDVAD